MSTTLSVETPAAPSSLSIPNAGRRWSRQVAVDIVGLLDALAIALGALLPALIYHMAGGMVMRWQVVIQTGLLAALVGTWCLNAWRLYDPDKVHDFPVAEGRLLAALAIAFVAMLGVGMPFQADEPHLWVSYAVWASLSFLLLLTNRVVARGVLGQMAKAGAFDVRVAVYGAGPIARRVRDHLVDPKSRIAFAGMYDDRPGERVNSEGLNFTGRLDDLVKLAHDGKVDRIVIALPAAADGRISQIAKRLEMSPASVHIVTHVSSDLVDTSTAHQVSTIGPVGLIDLKGRSFGDWAPFVKRTEDLVLGTLLLIVTAPLMAIIACLVKLESKGPVLVAERRRGFDNETFDLVRFRTTRQDELAGPAALTQVGRQLERFGLDELPQLLTVLQGKISVVGPRPLPVGPAPAATTELERNARRNQVKPGMTGLSQLEIETADSTWEDKALARDLAYIARWTPALDALLLWRTVKAAATGRARE